MRWPSVEEITRLVPLPAGYAFEQLRADQTHALAAKVAQWHPDIAVGAASCFLRPEFYDEKVFLAGSDGRPESAERAERDIMVVLITHAGEMVGLFAFEREADALTMYVKLLIVSPQHRNAKVGLHCLHGAATLARACGAEFAYTMATLKTPHVQVALEHAGYTLLGFVPGYDREVVGSGQVKRVFEAVYAKLLVGSDDILRPSPENMTPAVRRLFEAMFPPSASFEVRADALQRNAASAAA
ncbi:MAG: hypothetical protein IT500_14160 [Rubrivivax sp.]|nr:hypothetical protein [Rubrivivax sp.]